MSDFAKLFQLKKGVVIKTRASVTRKKRCVQSLTSGAVAQWVKTLAMGAQGAGLQLRIKS